MTTREPTSFQRAGGHTPPPDRMEREATTAGPVIPETPDALPASLPDGYRWIKVPVSDDEFTAMTRTAARMPSGRVWEALRRRAGMPQYPRGLKAIIATMNITAEEEEVPR